MSAFALSVRAILPECLLIGVACLQFLIGPFLVTERKDAGGKIEPRLGRRGVAR